jgi:hypothetical protein
LIKVFRCRKRPVGKSWRMVLPSVEKGKDNGVDAHHPSRTGRRPSAHLRHFLLCQPSLLSPANRNRTTGEDNAPDAVLMGRCQDVQQQIDVTRLDPCPAGARARIRRDVQHRIDTGELGRPGRIEGAQVCGMDGRVVCPD